MIDKKNRLFQILFLFVFFLLGNVCFCVDPDPVPDPPPPCTTTCSTSCSYSGTCNFTSWDAWSGVSCRDANGSESGSCSQSCSCPSSSRSWPSSRWCLPTPSQQCDTTPPTCTTVISPSIWTNTDVTASMGSCSDNLSGCGASTTEILSVHDTSTSVTVEDNAGNSAICSVSPKTKIDKKLPFSTGSGNQMETISYPGGDMAQPLSDSTEVSFAAHTGFRILTDIKDIAEGDSGRSGFVNACNSWITIKGPSGENSGSICAISGISLVDTGTTANIAISGYFKMAGHYSISFQIYDRAGNASDSVSGLLVHIVPGNVNNIESSALDILGYQKNGQSFIGSANCNDLTADNVEACGFQILLKDEFGNIIGKEGPLLNPPDLPACTFGFNPTQVSPPDNISTSGVNEAEVTVDWSCTDTNSLTYVCDGDIGIFGFGLLTPPTSGTSSYEFTSGEVSTTEVINCEFTANGGGGTSVFIKSFELLPTCHNDNSMFPICFDAEISLP